MRHLKVLGLTIAALALMAWSDVGAASATKLCKVNTNTSTCPAGQHYPAGTVVEASQKSISSVFENTSGGVENTCTETFVMVETRRTGSASETVWGEVVELPFEGCTQTTHTIVGGLWEFHHIGGTDNATLTVVGPEITMLLGGLTCTFGSVSGSIDLGTVVGGTGIVAINAILPKVAGSFLCPSDVRWKTEYEVTAPVPLYFTAG